MKDVWPTEIDFDDLEYTSSEECTIELTLRYSDPQPQQGPDNFVN